MRQWVNVSPHQGFLSRHITPWQIDYTRALHYSLQEVRFSSHSVKVITLQLKPKNIVAGVGVPNLSCQAPISTTLVTARD